MTANSTYSQQTLLERRLGSFPELNESESNSISSSNGIRPRKLKITKGKDRIIPVQYASLKQLLIQNLAVTEGKIEKSMS